MSTKGYQPEQIVNLLRQIEVEGACFCKCENVSVGHVGSGNPQDNWNAHIPTVVVQGEVRLFRKHDKARGQ